MRLYILLLIFTCLQYSTTAQQKNYKYYPLNINKAEEQAFVNNDIKGALAIYQNTFSQYDFVFVHDCMTAIELALYDSNARAFLAFVDKGTRHGLMPRHMMYIPYIKKHPLFAIYDDSVAAIYKRNRPEYLARIDTPALKKMYSLYGYDQMEKNPLKHEGFDGQAVSRRYKPQIEKTWGELKELIQEKGWPSDRLIGLEQTDIMKELKTGTPDMKEFFQMHKNTSDYVISETDGQMEEYRIHSNLFFAVMAHYGSYFDFNFFPDEVYIQQIEAGYLHPKDIAYVLDFHINWNVDSATQAYRRNNMRYFGTGTAGSRNHITTYSYQVPIEKIDAARAKFYIKPVKTEIAKNNFALQNKMFMGWGYWACRL